MNLVSYKFIQIQKYLVRCCSSIADYNETNMAYCWDCWNTGLLRDAESHCLSNWQMNLAFGSAYRFSVKRLILPRF